MLKHLKLTFLYIDFSLFFLCLAMIYQQNTADRLVDNRVVDSKKNSTIANSNTESNSENNTENETAVNVKKIALTFDDGPNPKTTEKLLDGLKSRNVVATFFVVGENAKNYPEIIKRMSDDGHIIGNHTYSHVQLTCINIEKAYDELEKTNKIIEDITGTAVKYVRPPYGFYNKNLATKITMTPILWTVDPRDWSVLNTRSVVKHVLKCVKDGDIILLHDIFDTSVDAALEIIDTLSAQGYTFVPINELEQNSPHYYMK